MGERVHSRGSAPSADYRAICYSLVTFGILCWLYWEDTARRRPGILFGIGLIRRVSSRVCFIEYIKTESGSLSNWAGPSTWGSGSTFRSSCWELYDLAGVTQPETVQLQLKSPAATIKKKNEW